jgi:hypothetical protein
VGPSPGDATVSVHGGEACAKQDLPTIINMEEVEIVRWPADADRLHKLRESGLTRLVLVASGARAPRPTDDLEDWVRLPATAEDIDLRIDVLRRRLEPADDDLPVLDADGTLHFRGVNVTLPPIEARLMVTFLARFGHVVRRDQLISAGWPGETVDRNVLDVHIVRLRRRLHRLHLEIRNVRGRGYLIFANRRPLSDVCQLVDHEPY